MNSIVIGSGFGGIAAALRLRAKGHKVTLIEKQKDLGGRARVFKSNGFTYDGGPTVITAPYLIYEIFKLFNKNPDDYIKIKDLDTWYRFVFEDGSEFDYSGDDEKMKVQIEKISKEKVFLVKLLDELVDLSVTHLYQQYISGCDTLMIFESWAGLVPKNDFNEILTDPVNKIIKR